MTSFSDFIPNYLVLGHVTKDQVSPQQAMLGGTCSYAALSAKKLGQNIALITSAGPDIPDMGVLGNIPTVCLPAEQSTTFENIYQDGHRQQKWRASAAPLSLKQIPKNWQKADIVHLGPVAQEMSPELCAQFPHSLICVTLQGWLRGTDAEFNVIYQPHPNLLRWLTQVDVLILSLADVFGQKSELEKFMSTAKVGVETLGPNGCRIYHQGQVTHIPVSAQKEVDPTGAGDIFATAFFIHYHRTGDLLQAGQFANACASLSVGQRGVESIPTLAQVQQQQARLYG